MAHTVSAAWVREARVNAAYALFAGETLGAVAFVAACIEFDALAAVLAWVGGAWRGWLLVSVVAAAQESVVDQVAGAVHFDEFARFFAENETALVERMRYLVAAVLTQAVVG